VLGGLVSWRPTVVAQAVAVVPVATVGVVDVPGVDFASWSVAVDGRDALILKASARPCVGALVGTLRKRDADNAGRGAAATPSVAAAPGAPGVRVTDHAERARVG